MTGATATAESATPNIDPSPRFRLNVDWIAHIDLSKLSQSELRSLSRTSSAAFDLRRTDDVVVPEIDRSIFNESSGSRRQTYSRLRPIPRSPKSAAAPGLRRRLAGLLPTPKPPPIAPDDHELAENRLIVDSLKQLIGGANGSEPSLKAEPDSMALVFAGNTDLAAEKTQTGNVGSLVGREMEIFVHDGQRKRNRDGKLKQMLKSEVEEDMNLEIVNQNGVAIDLQVLANADAHYTEELRRRTLGMDSELVLLEFLNNLGGQWGSRRKKRKIVNTCEFGDAFPIGWKLLIGIRRRVGRVSLYCRRYISPTGKHFTSCKEASLYLRSYFGLNETNLSMDHLGDNIQQSSGSHADPSQALISSLPGSGTSNGFKKEASLLEIDNLAEVQVRDLFECHKCDMMFDEKDLYLQHLLSSHKKTTRRYRLRTSVGDGVILKDGKYECQFCHKIFNERRRYNGHVGIHVRNHIRNSQELPARATAQKNIEAPPMNEVPPRFSKMDALIEIAQSSILEASGTGFPDGTDKLDEQSQTDSDATFSDEPEMEGSIVGKIRMGPELSEYCSDDEQESDHATMSDEMEKNDGAHNEDVEENSSSATATVVATEMVGSVGETCDTKLGLAVDGYRTDHSGCEMMSDEMEKNDGTSNEDVEANYSLATATVVATELVGSVGETCDIKLGLAVDGDRTGHSGCEISTAGEVEKYEDNVGGNRNVPNNDVIENMLKTDEENVNFAAVRPPLSPARCLPSPTHSQYSNVPNSDAMENIPKTCEENVNFAAVRPPLSPSHCLPSPAHSQYKGEKSHGVDQKLDSATGFDELKLDEFDTLKFSFLTNDAGMDTDFDTSAHFGSDDVMLRMAAGQHFTVVCVWCRMEFNHQAIGSEIHSDSVGFMCPTCKAQISGHLNELDTSFNHHRL